MAGYEASGLQPSGQSLLAGSTNRAASTSLALVIPAVLASTSGAGVVLLVPLPSTGVVSVPELGAVTDPLATMPLEEPIVVPLPTLVEPDGLVATVPLAA